MHVCVYQLIHCSDLLCALLSWIYTYICHCSVQVETALGTVNLANQNANQLPVPSLKAGTLTQKTWSDCSLSGGHTKTKQQLLTINTCTKKSPTGHMTSPGHDQSRAWPVRGHQQGHWVLLSFPGKGCSTGDLLVILLGELKILRSSGSDVRDGQGWCWNTMPARCLCCKQL